jgi:hypothetical protein
MNYDYTQSDLSRSVLSGLYTGIIATIANMIFVYVYRYISGFEGFYGMDVTVIVFGTILLSLACGIIFYFFVYYFKKGIPAYRIAVIIVTILIIITGLYVRRSIEGEVPFDFRIIVIITQVIIGGLAAFLIPYLFRHDKIIS